MSDTSNADVIRRCFEAYVAKDRRVIEELMSEDLRFTSPHDPDLDKARYMERCWPNSESMRAVTIEKLFVQGDEAFVRYEAETTSGERFRNTEYFRLAGGKIVEIQVYYGSLPKELLPKPTELGPREIEATD